MEKLPEEILDYIFTLVSQYDDLPNCKLVCKVWCASVLRVVQRKKCNLLNAIINNKLQWETKEWPESFSDRLSHSVCYYEGKLYMFGGSSQFGTAFNELSAVNLTTRSWLRHFANGTHPLPKTAASLCAYKGKLILYGGYTPPATSLPFQDASVFDELHTFNLADNTWTRHKNPMLDGGSMGPLSNHSVTVHGNQMITFGGIYGQPASSSVTNDIYSLNLDTMVWRKPMISSCKPFRMFGHSQIYLDQHHFLVYGIEFLRLGSLPSSTNHPDGVWLLSMINEPWAWRKIVEKNTKWAPHNGEHPVIKVEDYLVSLVPFSTPDDINEGEMWVSERCPYVFGRSVNPHMTLHVACAKNVVETGVITWQEPQTCFKVQANEIISLTLGNSEMILVCANRPNKPMFYFAKPPQDPLL